MNIIQASTVSSTDYFNLNGLEYPKGVYNLFYKDAERVDNTPPLLNPNTVKVGLREKANPLNIIANPQPFEEWSQDGTTPFTSYDDLMEVLTTLVGFDDVSGGGDGTILVPWDISTAEFLQDRSLIREDTSIQTVFFKPDGLKMYIGGRLNDSVYEYDLGIAWDISSVTYLQLKSITTEDTLISGLFFRADGLKMYISGDQNNSVYEYNLTTAWNVTTASYLQLKSVTTEDTVPVGLFFRSDGLKMYFGGSQNDSVYEYDLATAWNVTTASFLQSKSIVTEDTLISGVSFRPDGLKMYVTGNLNDSVYEYDLSTAWNVTTASFLQSFSLVAQTLMPSDLFFRADGLKMYISNSDDDAVCEYNLGNVDEP